MLESQRTNKTIESHFKSSSERLMAFVDYQITNPELNSVGCSHRDHNGACRILDEGIEKIYDLGLLRNI